MGKVKVKIVGDEQQEQKQKLEQKQKREGKKARGLNMGGGQRINTVGVSEEEIAVQFEQGSNEPESQQPESPKSIMPRRQTGKQPKKNKAEPKPVSKRYAENKALVGKNTLYPLKSGIEILRKFKNSAFDETVELHINVKEKGVAGQVVLPHGTGKKLRIAIADDALIAEVEQGKINFDILVATPDMMPKLAKVARVLGPKGLMPNPKNGTISDKPEQVVEKLSQGQVSYKTEAAAPIIHMRVGKLSFENDKLEENISTILASIGTAGINNITLKSTMSPGIPLQI